MINDGAGELGGQIYIAAKNVRAFNVRRSSSFSCAAHVETAAEHLCFVVFCVLPLPPAVYFYSSILVNCTVVPLLCILLLCTPWTCSLTNDVLISTQSINDADCDCRGEKRTPSMRGGAAVSLVRLTLRLLQNTSSVLLYCASF